MVTATAKKLVSGRILDQAYEQFKESGRSNQEIAQKDPQLLADRFDDETLLHKKAGEAAQAFEHSLQRYMLLENGGIVFMKLKRAEQKRIDSLARISRKYRDEERMQAIISAREEEVSAEYDELRLTTTNESRKLERDYGALQSQEYLRIFIKELVDAAFECVEDIGRYGRIYLYKQMIMQLMKKETREMFPNSTKLRTLAVKDMLLNEPDTFVRISAIRITGLGLSKYLHVEDLLMFDAAQAEAGI
ncbi:MAG: hypothetical protein KGI04_04920 [Candidatus Micrarchaeota archaeon]|nr:hypothetical protein [Candidatus Micrarchaeota archaeon]